MSLTDLNEELDVTFDHTEEQLSPATSPPTISEDHPVGTNREPELSKEAFVRRLKVPKTNTIVELSNLEKLEEFLQVGADADSFIFATSQVDDLEFIVVEGSIFVFNPPNQDLYNNSSRLSFRKSRNFRPLTLLGKTLSDYPISSFANIQQAVFKTIRPFYPSTRVSLSRGYGHACISSNQMALYLIRWSVTYPL